MTTAGVDVATTSQRVESKEAPGLPWWKRTGPVAALTSILAATVPATTAVWGLIQKDREMEAKKADQAHDIAMKDIELKHRIQMDFLALLKNDDERLRTLRMVEATNEDPRMIQWAKAEKDVIETPVRELQKQIADQKAKAEKADAALQTALAEGKTKAGQIADLRANANRQAQQLTTLRREHKSAVENGSTGTALDQPAFLARSKADCARFFAWCDSKYHGDILDVCGSLRGRCEETVKDGNGYLAHGLAWEVVSLTKP